MSTSGYVINHPPYGEATEDRVGGGRVVVESPSNSRRIHSEIIGQSSALKVVLEQVETVAPTNSTVLILGETGTGKELVARALRNFSSRREQPFVKVNCSAIPTGLLESELFGHERGAFTGAIAQRIGRFELADHGTLFLDEVGDISLELQPKLLRVLQEHEVERLGSARTLHVDVRLVAATSRNLAQMMEDREFRSDLYYRLNVFPIAVPPLRDRREDIPLLVQHFLKKYSRQMSKCIDRISDQTLEVLTDYHWPGNIRELQNVVERAVILCKGETLRVDETWLMPSSPKHTSASTPSVMTLAERETAAIESVLRETEGVVGGPAGAAVRLGIPRQTLQYKIRKRGINRYQFKTSSHAFDR
jgi:formate hydrogenlyase transcriptional activator